VSNLRRVPYTKPIPAGAQLFTRKGERFARFRDRRGKTVEAPLTEDGQRIRLLSKKWYGEYRDADGVEQCVPLATDRTAAEQMLAALVRKAELGRVGILDPFEEHRKRPLAQHLEDWRADLRAKGTSAKQVSQVTARASKVLDGCRFVMMSDLSASRVQKFLEDLRATGRAVLPLEAGKEWYTKKELALALAVKPCAVNAQVRRLGLAAEGQGRARRFPWATAEALREAACRGRSVQTSNFYLSAVKQFCNWLVEDRRMADNPLAHLEGGNVKLDRRHDRRPLSPAELVAVLEAARGSTRAFRGLTGLDRFHLYLTACGTGFRAGELASLEPESFDFDADPPAATVGAGYTKNKRPVMQPLPPDLVDVLPAYLVGKPAGSPLWPGNWADDAAEMLRIDLAAAGVPYAVEGPDGPLYADFHALRHSYIALLEQTGATLKQAMHLARHTDPKLTMARYGKPQMNDLGATVGRLPSILAQDRPPAEALAATGTDGSAGESLRRACASSEAGCERLPEVESMAPPGGQGGASRNPRKTRRLRAAETDCEERREVRPAGFEPATLGLGNRCSIP
jgi:integrase